MNKKDTILIVDDMELNRALLRNIFEDDYNLLEAEDGEQAVILARQYHSSIVIILLDLVMPVMDGYKVMEELARKHLLDELPVIVITAEDSTENEVKAFDLGASDIIMKPFEPYVVKRRVQNVIELTLHRLNQQELIEEQAAKLRESNAIMIDALSSIIEYRSVETGQHIQRIRIFTKILLENVAYSYPEFGLNERNIDIIVSASSMHDIGKIAIPDKILNKPGKLTQEEFSVMKTHTTKGCEMLANLNGMSDKDYLQYAYNICRYHHERWDGKGYPDGLRGDSIPICAQVVGIADCYDALTTDRVYKKAISPEHAFNMILNGECGTFSPRLLECLKNVKGLFEECTREYADGHTPKAADIKTISPVLFSREETLQMGQLKYFAMLQYTDATVMEMDLDNGVYHVVYTSGREFETLKTGKRFENSILHFIQESVHPEEQKQLLSFFGREMEDFFVNGLRKSSVKCRIYSSGNEAYYWCMVTLVRIEVNNPYSRKAMVIWDKRAAEETELPRDGRKRDKLFSVGVLDSLLGGVQTCKNDKWFTILQMNSGLKELLGYTEEKIQNQFQNRYLNFIYPKDRDMVHTKIQEQLTKGNFAELEYRITAKDGSVLWVLDKRCLMSRIGEEEYFLYVLVDITQLKKAQEELRLTLERHQIIMERSNDIIFEWDIENDTVSYSNNWEKKFGYQPVREEATKKIPKAPHLHPKDQTCFLQLIHDMKNGIPYSEIEFRVADAGGRYRWCKIRAAAQFDSAGRPFKTVGVVTDIDEEKRASQILLDEAQRDGLTKLYNKSSGRKQIEGLLNVKEKGTPAAMMIIVLDNFKLINDTYGHMFGDVVLQEFAGELVQLFRDQDIICRIGGDEFLIFMENAPKEAVSIRARKIIEASHRMFRENAISYTPSCSIGIGSYPEDGTDFETLFHHSDVALYDAKKRGKNTYSFYSPSILNCPFNMPAVKPTVNTRIESETAPAQVMYRLIEDAFTILYESIAPEDAIACILKMVGREFAASRTYIFEDSGDGRSTSNTFEWCNDGIESQKANLQNYAYDNLGGRERYMALFNEEGIFYCPDVEQLSEGYREMFKAQGIQSLLQCEIRRNGAFAGFVGFDDCKIKRFWLKDQIYALSFIAKMLSVFLAEKRERSGNQHSLPAEKD